jgi:hypothetical protein
MWLGMTRQFRHLPRETSPRVRKTVRQPHSFSLYARSQFEPENRVLRGYFDCFRPENDPRRAPDTPSMRVCGRVSLEAELELTLLPASIEALGRSLLREPRKPVADRNLDESISWVTSPVSSNDVARNDAPIPALAKGNVASGSKDCPPATQFFSLYKCAIHGRNLRFLGYFGCFRPGNDTQRIQDIPSVRVYRRVSLEAERGVTLLSAYIEALRPALLPKPQKSGGKRRFDGIPKASDGIAGGARHDARQLDYDEGDQCGPQMDPRRCQTEQFCLIGAKLGSGGERRMIEHSPVEHARRGDWA